MTNIYHKWFILSILLPAICAFTLSCNQANTSNQQTNIPNQLEITLEEAALVLDQAVQYTDNHNLDGLCSMGGAIAMCQHLFENAGGWDAIPTQHPEIIDSYILPVKDCGNGTYITGGRILVVKGVDGLSRDYQTDFFVFYNSETDLLSAQYPVYWGNFSVSQSDCDGSANVSVSQN